MKAPQFSPRIRDVRATGFDTINRYWNDRDYRAQCRIEADHQNAINHAAMDRRMIETGNKWPINWTLKEKHDATVRLEKGKV